MNKYLSLIKFSHTVFALPFALVGYILGVCQVGFWDRQVLLWVLFCMVFARSAAMAFNRYLDRDIDAQNPRTVVREIPSGQISPSAALWFVVINCLMFIAVTYFINPLCFYLSPVALLVVLGYSYTKRFTALCHFVLGLGLGLAPVGAYLAVVGHFDIVPIVYGFIVLLWVSGFDIIYALQDEDFDKSFNLNSVPVRLGKVGALRLSNILHLLCGGLMLLASFWLPSVQGDTTTFGFLRWIGAAIFLIMLFYQHLLVKPNDLSKVNMAFFTTNGIASVVFAALVITDIFIH